jgi:hypothetical protein
MSRNSGWPLTSERASPPLADNPPSSGSTPRSTPYAVDLGSPGWRRPADGAPLALDQQQKLTDTAGDRLSPRHATMTGWTFCGRRPPELGVAVSGWA